MKYSLCILFTLFGFTSTAFAEGIKVSGYKNEIGFAPLRLESSGYDEHFYHPKFFSSLFYGRSFERTRWSIQSQISYGNNSYMDDCINCQDLFRRQIELREANASLNGRFSFLKNRDLPLQPYVQGGLYAARIEHTHFGFSRTRKGVLNEFGITGRFGMQVYPYQHISVGVSSELRIAKEYLIGDSRLYRVNPYNSLCLSEFRIAFVW